MATPKISIVGAGPGGLAAAMLLANAGCEVDVFERLDRVGGRTQTFTEEGFRFDLGPTFFLYPRVLREIFRQVGAELSDEVDMVRLDPQYRIQLGGEIDINATNDPARMRAEIAKISAEDAAGFDRFIADNREKLAAFRPVLEKPFNSWASLLGPDMLKLLPHVRPWNSLDKELGRYFKDPRTRLAFSFQAKYLGMSPFRCPSIFTILSHLEYEHGVWHPIGGCGAVSQAMARVAERAGARIHLSEPVDEILYQGRRATGIRTQRGVTSADAVVVNGDFAHAMRHLVPDRLRPTWNDRKIDKARFSCSTYMLYLGIEGEVDLPHHTIHVPSSYRRNLDEIENRHVLSLDPSVYVQNACVTDPSLAPSGHSTLYVLVPVTHQHEHVDWAREKETYRPVVMRQLQRMGIPDLADRIRYERVITPADWEAQYAIHRGATFNLTHDLGQMLHKRPRNRFSDVDGMYLVGGGTHPGSGLPVIYEGARITSKLVADDLGLGVDWSVPPVSPTSALADVA